MSINSSNIKFLAQQEPARNAPGIVTDTHDPLARKAQERSSHYGAVAAKIAGGEQPLLGGQGYGDKWIKAQIEALWEHGFLTEEPSSYYRENTPNRTLGYNPIPHRYILEKQTLKRALLDRGIAQVYVTGEEQSALGLGQKLPAPAHTTIAIPGGVDSLREMLQLLNQKINHGDQLRHPLIIENPVNAFGEGFWDEILRGIKILDHHADIHGEPTERRRFVDFKALAEHYGIYVTESRADTLSVAEAVAPPQKLHAAVKEKPLIPYGSVVFVATGTKKKYDEFRQICAAQGIRVDIREIYELVDTYVSPYETSRTYEGNTAEKVEAAFKAWSSMRESEQLARLKHLGITMQQAFILAEDSGFHFLEPNLANEDEFRLIRHNLVPGAPFPGVETGPATIGSDGIRGFMRKVEHIFNRRAQKGNPPDYGVIHKSIVALAPLAQPTNADKIVMTMVASETKSRLTFQPQRAKGNGPINRSINIDDYFIPTEASRAQTEQTISQIGDDFINHHGPRAKAMQALAVETRIKIKPGRKAKEQYSPDFCAAVVVDKGRYASKAQAKDLEKKVFKNGFGIITTSASITQAADPQTNVLSKADGVVFALNPKRAAQDFWENLYAFTSMIVAEQTHDKYKMRKPFYLVNPKAEDGTGPFDYLEEMVLDCHHSGTVPENPSSLFKSVQSVEDAVTALKTDRKEYRRLHLPEYATRETPFEYNETPGTKDFNVAIFCSASNKNESYMSDARRMAHALVHEGFGLVSGAGGQSMMGEVTSAAYTKRDSHAAEHFGSNVPHIMQNEGDMHEKMTEFKLARHIYERMEYMMEKADGFAVMVGGTGTIQELALLALLKKRALEADDPYAKQHMEHKEIVIINSPMETQNRGFYDKLKELIDANDPDSCKELGIHFVKNTHEAMEHFQRLRDEKRERHGLNGVAHESLDNLAPMIR